MLDDYIQSDPIAGATDAYASAMRVELLFYRYESLMRLKDAVGTQEDSFILSGYQGYHRTLMPLKDETAWDSNEMALRAIGTSIVRVVKAILKALATAVQKVTDYIGSYFSSSKRLIKDIRKLETIAKGLKGLPQRETMKPPAEVLIGGKITTDVPQTLVKHVTDKSPMIATYLNSIKDSIKQIDVADTAQQVFVGIIGTANGLWRELYDLAEISSYELSVVQSRMPGVTEAYTSQIYPGNKRIILAVAEPMNPGIISFVDDDNAKRSGIDITSWTPNEIQNHLDAMIQFVETTNKFADVYQRNCVGIGDLTRIIVANYSKASEAGQANIEPLKEAIHSINSTLTTHRWILNMSTTYLSKMIHFAVQNIGNYNKG